MNTEHTHKTIKCICGRIISTCRCARTDKHVLVVTSCQHPPRKQRPSATPAQKEKIGFHQPVLVGWDT